MKNLKWIGLMLSLVLTAVSCERETEPVTTSGEYKNGILVANEGNFMRPEAEVSYINYDLAKIENNLYKAANNENLGDVLQNIGFYGDNAYFVMNNSNKIVITDRYTLKKKTVVTQELKQPRYIAFSGDKYYVTNAKDGGFVAVYNIGDNSLFKKIPIGKTSERIMQVGDNLFVQNAAYGEGQYLTIISPKTNTVTATIQVPNGEIKRAVAYKNNVFVYTGTANNAYIYQYSSNGDLEKTYELPGFSGAKTMDIENDVFYFTSKNHCYSLPFNATKLPTKPLFSVVDNGWATFYGFDVIDGFIYTSDAMLFTQGSEIRIFTITGKHVTTHIGSIGSNAFHKI